MTYKEKVTSYYEHIENIMLDFASNLDMFQGDTIFNPITETKFAGVLIYFIAGTDDPKIATKVAKLYVKKHIISYEGINLAMCLNNAYSNIREVTEISMTKFHSMSDIIDAQARAALQMLGFVLNDNNISLLSDILANFFIYLRTQDRKISAPFKYKLLLITSAIMIVVSASFNVYLYQKNQNTQDELTAAILKRDWLQAEYDSMYTEYKFFHTQAAVITETGDKYHHITCPHLTSIAEIYPVDYAESLGYSPCLDCWD